MDKWTENEKSYRLRQRVHGICAVCGKGFKMSKAKWKYCSHECQIKDLRAGKISAETLARINGFVIE